MPFYFDSALYRMLNFKKSHIHHAYFKDYQKCKIYYKFSNMLVSRVAFNFFIEIKNNGNQVKRTEYVRGDKRTC